jgi:hypothetical protein
MRTGDLGQNAERFHQRIRALPFTSVTCVDVGVRDGCSSLVMLDATIDKGESLVIGIEASEISPMLKRHPRYRVIDQIDSVTALSELQEPVHVAWIDTLHCAHQVAAEVAKLWPLMPVGSLLGLHDTHWPAEKARDFYCDRFWPSPDVAVNWLFRDKPYCEIEEYPDSWGTTFVWKRQNASLELTGITWGEVFAGRNELLNVLPESVRKRKWITNVRDATPVPMVNTEGQSFTGHRGDSICVTCGKEMSGCWDTVCHECGDTSCYHHSHELDGHWFCEKCAKGKL